MPEDLDYPSSNVEQVPTSSVDTGMAVRGSTSTFPIMEMGPQLGTAVCDDEDLRESTQPYIRIY